MPTILILRSMVISGRAFVHYYRKVELCGGIVRCRKTVSAFRQRGEFGAYSM